MGNLCWESKGFPPLPIFRRPLFSQQFLTYLYTVHRWSETGLVFWEITSIFRQIKASMYMTLNMWCSLQPFQGGNISCKVKDWMFYTRFILFWRVRLTVPKPRGDLGLYQECKGHTDPTCQHLFEWQTRVNIVCWFYQCWMRHNQVAVSQSVFSTDNK